MTVVNAKMQGMKTAYVENGVSALEASTTVGTEVIKAVAQKYQTNNKLGKATVEITGFGTIENITSNALISVYTTDYELIGTITLEDGILTWEEIEENIPAEVARVELSPTTLEIEQGATDVLEVKCYNSSNKLIPLRKLGNISITRKSGSSNITVTQDATIKNKAIITVDENETTGNNKAVITATVDGIEALEEKRCKINVKKKVPVVGQYVEYDISYTDMYVSDINLTQDGEQGFTKTNGWRILDPGTKSTLNGETIYTGARIISTGIPTLYMLKTPNASLNNSNVFENLTLTCNSINNGVTISGSIKGGDFKTSVASSVTTLTESDLDVALNILNGNTNHDSSMGNLFYLKDLTNFNYSSSEPSYWLSSIYKYSNNMQDYVTPDGSVAGATWLTCGIRPVITLSQNVYIKKNTTGIWEIKNFQ